MKKEKIVRGWKNLHEGMICNPTGDNPFKFEIGKKYTQKGKLEMCGNGFHFHANPTELFSFYSEDSLVAEVEASGRVIVGDGKSVCSSIKVIKVLTKDELNILFNTKDNLGSMNTGKFNTGDSNTGDSNTGDSNTGDSNTGNSNTGNSNTGYRNTGNRNTGDRNTGDSNTGDSNTGDSNTGDSNTGDSNTGDSNTGDSNTGDSNTGNSNTGNSNTGYRNTGNWNTGDRNIGNWNTGYRNTGNWNTGDRNIGNWNKSDQNSGHFNTEPIETIRVFNQDCSLNLWEKSNKPNFIYNVNVVDFIYSEDMTTKEKKEHPGYKIIGGYNKVKTNEQAWKDAWENKAEGEVELLEALPNFDWKVFTDITGIKKPRKKINNTNIRLA